MLLLLLWVLLLLWGSVAAVGSIVAIDSVGSVVTHLELPEPPQNPRIHLEPKELHKRNSYFKK